MSGAILVTGGTGTVGRRVVRRLLEDEHEALVLSRHERPEGERTPVKWRRADLRSGDGVADALSGVDVVVHCATSGRGADVTMTRNLVEAARRAGQAHLVYVSIVGIDRLPGFPYYRAKVECERLVTESGLPWSLLRATQFHSLVRRTVTIQRRLPVVLTLGGGVKLQPIAEHEVGERLAELSIGSPVGRAEDMAGPEVRPMEDLAREVLRAAGSRRRVLALRLPGRTFRAIRDGALLAPDHALGQLTFEAALGAR